LEEGASMPLIRDSDRRQLTDIFNTQLKDKVTLHFFTQHDSPLAVPSQECFTCRETGELLREVAGLSDKLELVTHDFYTESDTARSYGVDRIPALVLQGTNRGTVRFFGIPAGYEFAVLIQDLIDISGAPSRLNPAVARQLASITKPVTIKVLVTPT
jgi:alkyl hydroperoxide reductase subunit AhpF